MVNEDLSCKPISICSRTFATTALKKATETMEITEFEPARRLASTTKPVDWYAGCVEAKRTGR